jgi:hypothetical protein
MHGRRLCGLAHDMPAVAGVLPPIIFCRRSRRPGRSPVCSTWATRRGISSALVSRRVFTLGVDGLITTTARFILQMPAFDVR